MEHLCERQEVLKDLVVSQEGHAEGSTRRLSEKRYEKLEDLEQQRAKEAHVD